MGATARWLAGTPLLLDPQHLRMYQIANRHCPRSDTSLERAPGAIGGKMRSRGY